MSLKKMDKMDINKVLAILAQPVEKPAPLENVERLRLDIPYITKKGEKDVRPVRVVMPQGVPLPMPLIYVPHYEMQEDSLELRDYLAKGWAVASPAEFNDRYNGELTDDDLVFNNAALYTLRHRTEFDKNRIALAGGSAGAYMTLMLNGLQMGLCASVANGPIPNVYFNFCHYFIKADTLNRQAMEKLQADSPKGEMEEKGLASMVARFADLPIPFLAGLAGLFLPILDNFPEKEDYVRWQELSPVGLADCFCSPIMMNHCTSDVLVPVDQITRKYTYKTPGDSLPREFDMLLPVDLPGKLGRALDECLPEEDTRVERILVPKEDADSNLPYDAAKRFNINIYDDGPAEGYGTHSSRMDTGRRSDIPYLEEMMGQTAAVTCLLTPAMLKRLLLRYQGKSIPLPAHEGVDESVYGSLAVYRQEIIEELGDWVKVHGIEELRKIFDAMLVSENDDSLQKTMSEIMRVLTQ